MSYVSVFDSISERFIGLAEAGISRGSVSVGYSDKHYARRRQSGNFEAEEKAGK